MADLSDKEASLTVKITGADSLGSETNFLDVSADGALITSGATRQVSGSGSALNATPIPSTDVSGFSVVTTQLTGTFTATYIFEGSNDNVNWQSLISTRVDTNNSAPTASDNVSGRIYQTPLTVRFFRVRNSAYTSGTVNATSHFQTETSNDLNQRTVAVNGTIGATQSGIWNVRVQDSTGAGITSAAAGATRPLDIINVTPTGVRVDPRDVRALTATDVVTANAGSGTFQVNVTNPSIVVSSTDLDTRDLTFATDKVDVSNSTVNLSSSTLSALENISVDNFPAVQTVNGTIELGSSSLTALENITATVSGPIDLSSTTLSALESITVQNGSGASAVNIQDGGNSITVDGTVSISGSVSVTGPLTDSQLRATPVPVSGSVAVSGVATEATLSAINSKIPASPSQDRTTAAAPASTRLSDGTSFYDARQVRALTATDVVTANQGGTWNINNLSGTVSLPTGASTSALQTTGNTSLNNIDTKTPALVSGRVPVDGSAVTQPISAATLPLPTGAATSANQSSMITALNNIDAGIPVALGQTTMANSMPVVIASNQSSISVNTSSNSGGVEGAITVTTTSIAARVGVSNLANRQNLTIFNNSTNTIFWGYNSSVTTLSGTPLLRNQFLSLDVGPATTIFLIAASGSNNVRITEGA